MAPTVIEFFPKESVLCDEQNMNQLLKIEGRTLLNDLFIEYVPCKYFVFKFKNMVGLE